MSLELNLLGLEVEVEVDAVAASHLLNQSQILSHPLSALICDCGRLMDLCNVREVRHV